jgi:Tol biopolymer transport system component
MNDSDPRVRRFLVGVADTHRPDVEANLLAVMTRRPGPDPRRGTAVLVALVVAAVGIALAVWAFLPHRGGGRPGSEPTTATGGAGESILLTVVSGPRFDSDIWAMNPDGANARPVVTGEDSARDPALSPDGTTIAFAHMQAIPAGKVIEGTTCDQLFLVQANGTGMRPLTDCVAQDEGPAWSPDGTRIAFWSNRGGAFSIWVINADGTGMTKLTSGRSDSAPAWSPDGTEIAFASSANPGEDIYVVEADGTGLRRLTDDPGYEEHPVWSPDGNLIAFARSENADFAWDIWVMAADGTGHRQLTRWDGWDGDPVWSPDGSQIAFASDRGFSVAQRRENARDGVAPLGAVYLMDRDGTNVRPLTGDGFDVVYPASWGPVR